MPLVARTGQPAPDLVGEGLAELARPLAHGLVAHLDAAGGQHLFDHAQAQGKAEVEPDGVANDLARKAVTGVRGLGCGCHAGPLPVPTLSAKPHPKLTVPPHDPHRTGRQHSARPRTEGPCRLRVQIVAVDCVWPRAGLSLSVCRNSNSHLKHATFSVLSSGQLAGAPPQRGSSPNSRVQFRSCPASRMPNWLAS